MAFGFHRYGYLLFRKQPVSQRTAKHSSAHGAGTARAYQMGNEEGVVSSMVMMIAGMATVLLAPLLGKLFW